MLDMEFLPCSEREEVVKWVLQVLRYSWKGVWGLCYSRIWYYITRRLLVQMCTNDDSFQISQTLKMKATCSFRMSGTHYPCDMASNPNEQSPQVQFCTVPGTTRTVR
jgi:hypothetical protein